MGDIERGNMCADKEAAMRWSAISCAGGVFLFCLLSFAYAEDRDNLDIVKIFEQFVVSRAAASRCVTPPDETLARFQMNFTLVASHANQELQKRYPTKTKLQVAQAMEKMSDLISAKVFDLVREKGCDDPDVKVAIKRFYVQADWKPFGSKD